MLPNYVLAKENGKNKDKENNSIHNRLEDMPEQSNSIHTREEEVKQHPEQSNAIFTRDYESNTSGADGAGVAIVTDENDVFDYEVVVEEPLMNGDNYYVNALNKGGKVVKTFEFEVIELVPTWYGFDFIIEGFNGEGILTLTDDNDYVDYYANIETDLSNGDTIIVEAISNGTSLGYKEILVDGLTEVWDTFIYSIGDYNGFASFNYQESNDYVYYNLEFGVNINGSLSTGDEVTVYCYREGTDVFLESQTFIVPDLLDLWEDFSYTVTGLNGEGIFEIIDSSPTVEYVSDSMLTGLSNSDLVLVQAEVNDVIIDTQVIEVSGLTE
jgi:hypothetical protein